VCQYYVVRDFIKVLVLGTGQVGPGITRLVPDKPGLQLADAYGRRNGRAGMDLGQTTGLERDPGLPISNGLVAVIRLTRQEIGIQANRTSSCVSSAMGMPSGWRGPAGEAG
jgi:hypothetical protein